MTGVSWIMLNSVMTTTHLLNIDSKSMLTLLHLFAENKLPFSCHFAHFEWPFKLPRCVNCRLKKKTCQSQRYTIEIGTYFLHLRIKLSRNSNVNAYPLLPVPFLTMGKFLNKHSDEIERTDKLCKKMFYSDLFFCQTFPWMISSA